MFRYYEAIKLIRCENAHNLIKHEKKVFTREIITTFVGKDKKVYGCNFSGS